MNARRFVLAAIMSIGLILSPTAGGAFSEDDYAYSLQHSFNRVSEDVLPVVVEINVIEVVRQNLPRFHSPWPFFFGVPRDDTEPQDREFRRPGLGSGVIVRREGDVVYVLSNNHVVGDANEISIRLYDGREFEGEIVGTDDRTDLALVKFRTSETVPIARLGDSDSLEIGDWVLAVGNPFGFESTVTAGIVSAVRRDPRPGSGIAEYTDYIQTDAAINPGNSGGALVNLQGEVVGINTWIASRSGGSVGLGFAIPINNARGAIDEFIQKGRISYGWLGVTIADIEEDSPLAEDLRLEDTGGAFVTNVFVGSPAEEHGILPGDFITKVNGRDVDDARELSRLIGMAEDNRRVLIELVRQGRRQTARVELGERPEEPDGRPWPGFTVTPLTEELRERLNLPGRVRGVVVRAVMEDSAAEVVGIAPGDVIPAVGNEEVSSVPEFYDAINRNRDLAYFTILRNGVRLRLGIERR
ncbi:MAG: Do family serine endopeptidase [Spirochaetaceae bacterium]